MSPSIAPLEGNSEAMWLPKLITKDETLVFMQLMSLPNAVDALSVPHHFAQFQLSCC